jgi:hypothetical protein
MITRLDRRRIYIFVSIAYGFSMLLALVVFLSGGIFVKIPGTMRPAASILMTVLMLVPAIASIATRLITREGWANMLLRPKFRACCPIYIEYLHVHGFSMVSWNKLRPWLERQGSGRRSSSEAAESWDQVYIGSNPDRPRVDTP